MQPLRVGIVGLRHLHPRAYMASFASVSEFEVVAAAENDPAVREAFGRDFAVRCYGDWREMIEHETLQMAAIFLPHVECPEAAIACARRGLHVMVEKPMAASAAGAWSMVEAAREARVVLSTPYVWRFHPVVCAIRESARAGDLGTIVGCEGRCAAGRLHRYIEGHAAWMLDRRQSGGGPMYNLGVHWIDLYRWLLEDEVVDAVGRNVHVNREFDVEDNSFALLTFARGTVLSLDISYTVPDSYPAGRDLYLALRGTRGVVQWSPSFEGTREDLFVCTAEPRHVAFEIEPHPGYAGIMTVRYLHALARTIVDGGAPPVSGEDGARALEVVEKIYASVL